MIKKYPDETSYAEILQFDKEFIFRINSYNDLWYLKQIVDVYKHNGLRPTINIPNLIDAQADRRFKSNQSYGLKLVCEFLNEMHADFKIFHPHNSEVIEALVDNVEIIDNSGFILRILNLLNANPNANNNKNVENTILMSSDAGGFKPLIKLCDKINWKGETFSASKSRNPDSGALNQLVDRADFQGKDILIIDDICVYGGTFKGLSQLLKQRNCGKLYLAVSHLTVQNLGENPVTNYFDEVFTTNSKYENYIYKTMDRHHGLLDTLIQPKNLSIIKLF